VLERAGCRVAKRYDSEGDEIVLLTPSPSGVGRGDSTLPYTVSLSSATELTWGMKLCVCQTS